MYGYVWLLMAVYGYVWLCRDVYGCVWLCRAVYGYLWLCMAMCGYVGLCMAVYGYVWLCMAMYGYVWLCMARYGCVGPCMAVYGYGCLCMSVYSYVCPYRPVRINYSGHFMGHTWTTYQNITFPVLSPARESNNFLSLSILSISVRIFLQGFRCAFTSRSPRTAFGFSRLGPQALSTREAKLHKDVIMHRVG